VYAVSIALATAAGAAGGGLRPHAQRPVLRQQGPRRLPQRPPPAREQAHALADALIGTGFPFRKGDNFKRYVKMFEEVMQSCAGLRRPGAAALDLCYVAAGYYDGFFETGLNPWDVAAGSLIITEAGGLIGNFTGEADYLYQREVVAGNPKVYGQLVQILAPYTRVIKESAPSAQPG
jgi:myo-inositol-1(or 4)-monophosphatase